MACSSFLLEPTWRGGFESLVIKNIYFFIKPPYFA